MRAGRCLPDLLDFGGAFLQYDGADKRRPVFEKTTTDSDAYPSPCCNL
jgi:hypothetical protein